MDGRPRLDGDLFVRPRRAGLVATAMFLVVVAATVLVTLDTRSPVFLGTLDERWRAFVDPSPPWVGIVSRWLYVIGGGFVMIPLRIAVAVWLATRRRWVDLVAWLGAWAIADLVTHTLKPGVGRIRPDLSDASSFPSGHAKTAAQVAIGLVLVLTSPWRARSWAWVAAVAWIVAMSISRTVLVEHHLSDVVAGAMIGAASALGAAAIAQLARDRRVAAETLPARD